MLKPQDLVLALKLQASGRQTYQELGVSLGVSPSQAYASAGRAIQSGLLRPDLSVRGYSLFQALISSKLFFPPVRSGRVRGILTGYSVPPMNEWIAAAEEAAAVWPQADGGHVGEAWAPLHKSAVVAALSDEVVYEYLALVDCLRYGRAREVELATGELHRRLVGD